MRPPTVFYVGVYMGLRIGTNTQSLAAQRNLAINNGNQKNSLEKLASGSRINRAADDAAGLAIAEQMRMQIRSVRQDIRNSNDGISLIQTAEGAMNEVGNSIVRMRELSIQASSDTVTDTERGFIDKEVQQLKSEINRIAQITEFNGHKLLNGQGDKLDIQVGVNNNPEYDRYSFDLAKTDVTSGHLGIDHVTVADKDSSRNNLAALDEAMRTLTDNRAELGALQNRLQATVGNLNIYDENLSGARSRIWDVDMASETAELTKNNILSTAGTAVLSQANQNSMLALKLLS